MKKASAMAVRSKCSLKMLVLFFCVLFLIIFHAPDLASRLVRHKASVISPYELSLANSTLGFGHIFALTVEDPASPIAWRQKGLMAAANMTGIDFDFYRPETDPPLSWYAKLPPQQDENVPKDQWTRLEIGTALSLKGHMEVLQKVIESGVSTALILEDDADWDVRIREQLKPNGTIAEALRSFEPDAEQISPIETPYGTDWDILHLGHCHYNLPATQERYVSDPTAQDPQKVRASWSHTHYAGFPPNKRGVFQGASGVCVFGYGVTQAGARKLIELNKWDLMYDSIFWDHCRDGSLKCNIIAPELVHHQRAVGTESTRLILDKGGEASKPERFFTMNIQYSARCNANPEADYVTREEGSEFVQCGPSDEEFLKLPD